MTRLRVTSAVRVSRPRASDIRWVVWRPWGSGGGCREVSESADAVDDQPTPGGLLGEVDDDAAGSSGEGRGDGVEAVAEPFRFPAASLVTGQGQHPAPGLQLGGLRDGIRTA